MSGRLPTLASRGILASRAAPSSRQLAQRQGLTSRTYATFEGEPLKKRRSFLPRFLLWTTTGTALFYGGSTIVALNNKEYQDWFADSVPFAEDILDYLDTHDVVSEARRLDIGGLGSEAINSVGSGYTRVAQAAKRALSDAEDVSSEALDKAHKAEKDAKAKILETKEQARAQVAKISRKEEPPKVEKVKQEAKEEASGALATIRAKADKLVGSAKAAADKAEDAAKKVTEKQLEKPAGKPYDRPLPLAHEAPEGYYAPRSGDRKLVPEQSPEARLRPDPEAVKLPQLAPALSSLTGSEPMIGQLAGTIDDLANFLKGTAASGPQAKHVLDEAKSELQRLSSRLDEIRKSEQARAEKSLSQQAKKFEDDLKREAEAHLKKYNELDTEGKQRLEAERRKASADYEKRLRTELETQREIINERLKEEVVAQGVEMQRRWQKEIKERVEQERGGRLARLEELANELGQIEKVTLDNSTALQAGSDAHRTTAAVRALLKAAVADVVEDGVQAGYKRPFRRELELIRSSNLSKSSEVVQSALQVLESSVSPDEGVESLSSLTTWYIQKVKPRLQSVALLPEQAGLLSHITSAILSPLLFTKVGNVQGDDVPSILARAEYALLQRKDLDTAAREINQLKGWAKVLAEDWLNESRKRLEVEQSLKIVQAEASYNGLLNA
ncbi:unnamed protein product [Sympodiomycopsis kandeliae]